ncbi:MAG: 3-keto-disaccharide hydrolase [Tamlana sp.]
MQRQNKRIFKSEGDIEVNTVVDVKNDSDWVYLFDGTNFEKWRGYLKDEMYSEWTIEDGAMMFTPGEECVKNITTRDTFTNFELSLEWKISEGGNSGIFFGVYEDEKI